MKTKGAKDLKKRKKRKLYAGKPIKKKRKKPGRMTPYVPVRKKDAPIKLWFWEEKPMSKEGYYNFPKKIRGKIRKIIYKPQLRIDVDPQHLSNTEEVKALCLEHLWEGVWLMMGFSHGKNKVRVKPVKLVKIRILESPDGLVAKIITNYRLYRYWFWMEKQ